MELLDRIDRAVNGECPCGAEPREGSAYCSDDCTPTHISDDTDQYATGVRWRPDLVTAHDDSSLRLWTHRQRGSFTAATYQYADDLDQDRLTRVHQRLDDGHRYVGCDVAFDGRYVIRSEEAWQRLERELADSQRLDPDGDPWADAMVAEWNAIHRSWLHSQFGIAEPEADPDAFPALVRATCALRHLTAAVPQLRTELDAQEHPIA